MIPLYRPTIRRVDMDAVLQRLAGDAIGTGAYARDLASGVAKFLEHRGGVAVRSVGIALSAAFEALAIVPGSRIGVSALAPTSALAAIERHGCQPVILDVAPDAPILESPLNADYAAQQLDAIVVDTKTGFVPDLVSFSELSVPVVELVSEGYGGYVGDRLVGSFGSITVVGLEADHIMTAGGGAVCLAGSKRLVDSLRASLDVQEHAMPDMNAALGITQLGELPRFIEKRHETLSRYHRVLAKTQNRTFVHHGDGECVFSAFPVRISASPVDVQKYAEQHGVQTGRIGSGTALGIVRSDSSRESDEIVTRVKNAVSQIGTTVLFPLYPAMRGEEVARVESVLGTLP